MHVCLLMIRYGATSGRETAHEAKLQALMTLHNLKFTVIYWKCICHYQHVFPALETSNIPTAIYLTFKGYITPDEGC